MSIIRAIQRMEKAKINRGWDTLYYYFDIHETILKADYRRHSQKEFYPHAKEVLQYLSACDDIVLGLYTCSYPLEIERYIKFFKEHNIHFKYVNENPEAKNTKYGYYRDKPYFSVLFEDKAGFDAETDWLRLKEYFGI